MRVAILGAGFAGLAVSWYLLNYTQGSAKIDLFDPEPIGGSTSGLASGLLHAYAGKQAKVSWEAKRSIKETHRLITVASQGLGQTVILSKGILRPAISDQQIEDFQVCASKHSDTEWWESKKCEDYVQGLRMPKHAGGLMIKSGLTIDSQAYLQGLWQSCALLGTQYHQTAKISKGELEAYDRIVITMGAQSRNFPGLQDLPLTPVKGQILRLKWPEEKAPLPCSIISQKYLVMCPDRQSCWAGATFEHQFTSPAPDVELAKKEILPKILSFFPSLEGAQILDCPAAFRASTPQHLPLVGQVSEKFYFFTGLGSKGLLYHAWIAKRMARALLTGKTSHFPPEIYYKFNS